MVIRADWPITANWPLVRFRFRVAGDFQSPLGVFQPYNCAGSSLWLWHGCVAVRMQVGTENALQDRPNNEKRRSERVKLTVPVLVTTATVDGRETQEITHTAIVNAHGGLFRSTMEFLVAQPLVLTNLNTNLKERARVVHAERLLTGGGGGGV